MHDKFIIVKKDGIEDEVRESLLPKDEDGFPITNIKSTMTDGIYDVDIEVETIISNQDFFKAEYDWAKGELDSSDIELNKVLDSDINAVGTESEWRIYRKALRAYCSYDSATKLYSVDDITSTYTVGEDGRPIAPSGVQDAI